MPTLFQVRFDLIYIFLLISSNKPCFPLLLIGTNAMCERLFSLIKNYWTDEKSQLTIQHLKNWLSVKYNMSMSCKEFHSFIQTLPDILKKVLLFRIVYET